MGFTGAELASAHKTVSNKMRSQLLNSYRKHREARLLSTELKVTEFIRSKLALLFIQGSEHPRPRPENPKAKAKKFRLKAKAKD